MSNVRFIGDTHFGHLSMAKLRGFDSVEEHDNHIIKSWNSVVNKKDITYLLGDVTMEKSKDYEKLALLKGRIIVVLGNHDLNKHCRKLLEYVENVAGVVKYKGCFITHVPIHPVELSYRIRKNIHAHMHSNYINDSRYICVSCEQVDYKPKTLLELTGFSKQ